MGLVVVVYKKPEHEIRGKTRRYLYEIRPNVYTGRISPRVREELWKLVKISGTEGTMIYESPTEQGFEVETTYSDKERAFIDMEGIKLLCKERPFLGEYDIYAKPDKPLIDHMLDVGYIAEAIMRYGSLSGYVEEISDYFQVPKDTIINGLAFFCALHDIGKSHPSFMWTLIHACEK